MTARVLIAGVGNVFLGDDGFGPEVARRLAAETLPAGATAMDYGIRGMHLAFDLLARPELLVVVDALSRPQPPGTLVVLEPDLGHLPQGDGSPHGMDLPAVFEQVRQLGGSLPRVQLVGCVPSELGERLGLTPTVAAAVDGALALVRDIVQRELGAASPDATRESWS